MTGSRLFVNVEVAFQLKRLLSNFPFTKDNIRNMQLVKLKRLLIKAYRDYDFFRDVMTQARIDPYQVRDISELEKLPIMDRHTYRQFIDSVIREDPVRYEAYYQDATSGSSGEPLLVYRTWRERAYMLAKFLRTLFLNGYQILDRTYSIPMPNKAIRHDALFQRLGLMRRSVVSAEKGVENWVEGYMAASPDVFYANKSHMVQMALFIQRQGLVIRQPKFYVYVGEVLDSNSRDLITATFGSDNLVEIYGTTEFSTLGFQIRGNDFLHFCHDTNILELTDIAPANALFGTAVITDFHIHSFPLIRYVVNDRLKIEYRDGLPVIRSILGRTDDVITLRDGRTCAGPIIEVIMEKYPAILQYRIVQESHDLIRVVIVSKEGTDNRQLEHGIVADLRQFVTTDVDYQFAFVRSIPPDPNGKLRMLISKVAAPKL